MAVFIIAHKSQFAEFAARSILKVDTFTFVDKAYRLQGIPIGSEVIVVRAPRYVPNLDEAIRRSQILELCYFRELKIKEVELP